MYSVQLQSIMSTDILVVRAIITSYMQTIFHAVCECHGRPMRSWCACCAKLKTSYISYSILKCQGNSISLQG